MKLAALILAGGLSRRMGQDKALLETQGIVLLRRIWDVAAAVTSEVWVATPWRDRYAPYLPETTRWVEEAPPALEGAAGPLAAFANGLAEIDADWVLLLACDLPNLQTTVLQGWAERLPQIDDRAIALVPQKPKGWDPLCGFYRRSCLTDLRQFLASGQRAFQPWLDQHLVVPIPDVPVGMLANCNTPEDWQHIQTSKR